MLWPGEAIADHDIKESRVKVRMIEGNNAVRGTGQRIPGPLIEGEGDFMVMGIRIENPINMAVGCRGFIEKAGPRLRIRVIACSDRRDRSRIHRCFTAKIEKMEITLHDRGRDKPVLSINDPVIAKDFDNTAGESIRLTD